jgi:hypothetical protein
VVYELRRARPDAGSKVVVEFGSGSDMGMTLQVHPAGRGYDIESSGAFLTSGTTVITEEVHLSGGDRYFIAGVAGHLHVRVVNDRRWALVPSRATGYRVVRPPVSGRTDTRTTTLAGGAYGSVAYVWPRCGYGTYSAHLAGEEGPADVCLGGSLGDFLNTSTSKAWVVEEQLVAPSASNPVLLAVLDLPRRP